MVMCWRDRTICSGIDCNLRNSCQRFLDYERYSYEDYEDRLPASFVEPMYSTETNDCENYVPA